VEPVEAASLRPEKSSLGCSLNAVYFHDVVRAFGIEDRATLLLAGTRETVGLPYEQLRRVSRRSDLLLNLSGLLADPALLEPIPRRVYLDLDPAFVQLWHDAEGIDMRFAGHTHYVTVGLALADPDCTVPTCGLAWITTLQPVVLDAWPAAESVVDDAFTTVANWRGYGSITHNGVHYGQKAHSLRELITLPRLTEQRFCLALSIHPDELADVGALRSNGWELLDPAQVAGSPIAYQRFLQGSKAELGIAKRGYVVSRCGWFSDRSACYLASGRPVLAQETGFSRYLPTGDGLLSFETLEEAQAGIEEVRSNYQRHARAARDLAATHFDSDRTLHKLMDQVGVAA
jgi:hypothetical protein